MFSFLHDPRARSINLLERFFFFIDRVHLGVPDGKRVIEIHHYQSHQRVVGVPLTASTAWENTKNTKRERKSEKAIMFIERFSERRQPRVQQLSQTGRYFDTCCGELFQPNALQK